MPLGSRLPVLKDVVEVGVIELGQSEAACAGKKKRKSF